MNLRRWFAVLAVFLALLCAVIAWYSARIARVLPEQAMVNASPALASLRHRIDRVG